MHQSPDLHGSFKGRHGLVKVMLSKVSHVLTLGLLLTNLNTLLFYGLYARYYEVKRTARTRTILASI